MKYKTRHKKNLSKTKDRKTGSFSRKQTISSEVFKKLSSLKKMLLQQDLKCWDIGDLCIELLDRDRLSLGDIAHATGYSRTRISHFHLTCRMFSPDERKRYTFQDSLTAQQIHISLPRLAMTPVQIRDEICKLKNKTVRQVREHFVDILVKKEMARTVADSLIAPDSGVGLINNCHHSDWRKIIPKLPDQSVHLFICDPPFAQHKIKGKRGYVSSRAATNGMRNDSDYNLCEEEALSVTLPLFELCLPKLAPGGMLLLFQAGGRPDRIEVLQKAQEYGWDCVYGLTWKKGELSVSNMQNPYRVCTERILLFCGKGNKLTKCQNGLPHSDILDFPTETPTVTNKMNTGQMAYADYHMFQKPPALMEFLIQQHSHPGNLVVEAFGCSGSGCIAAAVREIDARVLHHNGDVQQLFYKPSTETSFIITESNFINTTVQKLIWQILITEKYSIYSYDMSRIEHYSVTGMLIFTALSRSVTPRIVLENVDWIIEIGDYSPQQRLLCVLQRLKYCQMNYECEEALSRIVEVGGIKLREIIRFLRICIAFARREGQVVRKEDVEKAAKIWM